MKRIVCALLIACALTACDGLQYRQRTRDPNAAANDDDYRSIAVATFKLIDPRGNIQFIVVPSNLDSRRKNALKAVAKLVVSNDDPNRPGYTLPANYFALRTFSIEDGVATIAGQLGPVTDSVTAAGMRDCGKIYSVAFYLDGEDWATPSYKVDRCDQARVWWPVDGERPQ